MTWVGLIWAEAAGGVIGAEGGMPWYVPEDLAHPGGMHLWGRLTVQLLGGPGLAGMGN